MHWPGGVRWSLGQLLNFVDEIMKSCLVESGRGGSILVWVHIAQLPESSWKLFGWPTWPSKKSGMDEFYKTSFMLRYYDLFARFDFS